MGKTQISKLYGVKSVNRRRIGYEVTRGNGRRLRKEKKRKKSQITSITQ